MTPGDLCEVQWHDAERVTLGWATAEEYQEALAERAVYRTAGYFVADDDSHVMVSHSHAENGNFSDAMVIPKAVVISVVALVAA